MRSLLLFSFLAFCSVASAQIINFPDANFKNVLVNTKCASFNNNSGFLNDADINDDGEIDINEAKNVIKLFVYDQNISSLSGIENFTNLTYLHCGNNQLSTLNINSLKKLESLDCNSNELSFLNIDSLVNLTTLNCYYNQISNIKISHLKNLKELFIFRNLLTSLEVNGLVNLESLLCGQNQLTTLEVDNLSNLVSLYCGLNHLSTLSVQGLDKLVELSCQSNNLTSLNAKIENGSLIYLNLENNKNLQFICCVEKDINRFKNIALDNGYLNCEVNSYCSFTPGGKFFILNGENNYDDENNGCDDLDILLSGTKYIISNGNITGTIISNSLGKYQIPLQAGIYTITPILESPQGFTMIPTSSQVTFPSTSDTITQDFCITPKGVFRQTNITVIPLSPPARPGFDASYKIVWENVGNQVESGTLNFTYDETLLDYISATQTADQVADGIIKWNFSNLQPFEKREITVTLKVNRPIDTPAVNAGDKLYFTASILDNIFTLENTVVGSYDPNDKTCLQGDRVKPDMVGEYVDYLIRFENTGNYAAENVVVKDIIDTKTFDVRTLKITDASHEVYTRIEGNKVEFIFENIQLPFDDANNDGYIAFKIKTLPSLVLGDSLKNLADIYFDYNFPIRTNEAQTTIALPSFTQDIATEVNIYPNPVRDILYLESKENWSKAEIFDISGRVLRSISLESSSIDVSGLESGSYFVRLKEAKSVGLVKFVKI